MPRYYFNFIDGSSMPDEDGTELPDLDAARHAAVDMVAEELRGSRERLWQIKQSRLEIMDPTGTILATLIVSAEDGR